MKSFTFLLCAAIFGNVAVWGALGQSTIIGNYFATVPLGSECNNRILCSSPASCIAGTCQCGKLYIPFEHRCVLRDFNFDDSDSDSKRSARADLVQQRSDRSEANYELPFDPSIISITSAAQGLPIVRLYRLTPLQFISPLQLQTTRESPISSSPNPLSDAPFNEENVDQPFSHQPHIDKDDVPTESTYLPTFSPIHSTLSLPVASVTVQLQPSDGWPPSFAHPTESNTGRLNVIGQPRSLQLYDPIYQYAGHFPSAAPNPKAHIIPAAPTVAFSVIHNSATEVSNPDTDCKNGHPCAEGSLCYLNLCLCQTGTTLTRTQCSRMLTSDFTKPVYPKQMHSTERDGCSTPCVGSAKCFLGFCICPNNSPYNRSVGCGADMQIVSAGSACDQSSECGVGAYCDTGVCRCTPAFTQLGSICLKKHSKLQSSVIENGVEVNKTPSRSSENSQD